MKNKNIRSLEGNLGLRTLNKVGNKNKFNYDRQVQAKELIFVYKGNKNNSRKEVEGKEITTCIKWVSKHIKSLEKKSKEKEL